MKKIIAVLMVVALTCGIVGCGAQNSGTSTVTPEINTDTLGGKYLAAFSESSSDDPSEIAEELIEKEIFEASLIQIDVVPGYLDGFREDITGFSNGVRFSPMIGSIPFVGYILEADDPDALLKKLQDCSDPAWNICTMADETVSMVKGNLVFFLMCSNEE